MSDDLQTQLSALRHRLQNMDREALVELSYQLSATYLVEGLGTLSVASDLATPSRDEVGEETFAGMLRRLKRDRPTDPVLERFVINGEHIQVKTPMGNVDVTEYRRAAAPARPQPPPPPAAVPTPRDSIYNRELHEPAQPRGAAPAAAPAPSNRPAVAPAPAARPAAAAAQPKPADKDKSAPGERFRMIELD